MVTNKLLRCEYQETINKMDALRKYYQKKAQKVLEAPQSIGHELTYRILSHKAEAITECLSIIKERLEK